MGNSPSKNGSVNTPVLTANTTGVLASPSGEDDESASSGKSKSNNSNNVLKNKKQQNVNKQLNSPSIKFINQNKPSVGGHSSHGGNHLSPNIESPGLATLTSVKPASPRMSTLAVSASSLRISASAALAMGSKRSPPTNGNSRGRSHRRLESLSLPPSATPFDDEMSESVASIESTTSTLSITSTGSSDRSSSTVKSPDTINGESETSHVDDDILIEKEKKEGVVSSFVSTSVSHSYSHSHSQSLSQSQSPSTLLRLPSSSTDNRQSSNENTNFLTTSTSNSTVINPSPTLSSSISSVSSNSNESSSSISTSPPSPAIITLQPTTNQPNNKTPTPDLQKQSLSKSSTKKPTNNPINGYIKRLLAAGGNYRRDTRTFCLASDEIKQICLLAGEIFLSQPVLLELGTPVKVVGDIHGQYSDLLRIFRLCGMPPKANYLFLGDYVDRGKQSLETILLLLCLKIKHPENVFLLRGNHECASVTKVYGFYDECKRRCSVKVWKSIIDVFNTLPIAATIGGKIFCIHGGLSPHLHSMNDILNITRPTDVPDEGLLSDLLWSDPDPDIYQWSDNDRGVSYCFSKSVLDKFCRKFGFDLVARGHMVVEDGYEFFGQRKLVTVFSAPNYCGEFGNWGAVLSVSKDLLCSFDLLKPLDSFGQSIDNSSSNRSYISLTSEKRHST